VSSADQAAEVTVGGTITRPAADSPFEPCVTRSATVSGLWERIEQIAAGRNPFNLFCEIR